MELTVGLFARVPRCSPVFVMCALEYFALEVSLSFVLDALEFDTLKAKNLISVKRTAPEAHLGLSVCGCEWVRAKREGHSQIRSKAGDCLHDRIFANRVHSESE
jgi:hypothetical protein